MWECSCVRQLEDQIQICGYCDSVEAVGWTITECACQLGVTRNTLSRLLNERIGISPTMALALEQIGWSNANHWMRLQAAYDLAQEWLKQERY